MDLNSNMLCAYTNFLRTDFKIYNPDIIAISQLGDCSQWCVTFDYKGYRFHLGQGINWYPEYYNEKYYVLEVYDLQNNIIDHTASSNKIDIINFINKITMNTYQKELIEEHSGLVVRTQNLHNYVYSEESANDHRVEFANKCIQLASMKKYEEALRARLTNAGIVFENGQYLEKVAEIKPIVIADTIPSADNEFDANKANPTHQGDKADE